MRYECCDERRLRVVKLAGLRNGIEYLEMAITAPADPLRERTLFVRLLLPAAGITADQVRIDGGERIKTVGVDWVAPADALPAGEDPALVAGLDAPDHVLVVRTSEPGDFSYYTLHIDEPSTFDPLLMTVEFTFKIDCDGGFDCRNECVCGATPQAAPELDYLAKDYASLRRLMLDRLSLVTPRWRERHAADLGIALVELIAYEADRLSYRQDAIATEAYLGTARSRVSLRRHARLVDYRIHDGCSARVLLRCTPDGDAVKLPAATQVFSRVPTLKPVLDANGVTAALAAGATVFETVDDAIFYTAHETLTFYAWGDEECCIPAGSTSATLYGDLPNLKAGDILVISEVLSPTTGAAADADPNHTWPVRLTQVTPSSDPSGGLFLEPPTIAPVPVTEIVWDDADAVPFPVCVSATAASGPVSVAWGNIVIADHGAAVPDEALGAVPQPFLTYPATTGDCGPDEPPQAVPARYRPHLKSVPLTRSVQVNPATLVSTEADAGVLADLGTRTASNTVLDWLSGHGIDFRDAPVVVRGGDGEWSVSDGTTVVRIRFDGTHLTVLTRPGPAATVTTATPELAQPQIHLTDGAGDGWSPQWDLLASAAGAREFAVETEFDGTAYLRLNEPVPGTAFTARYRVGNGVGGNLGARTLVHIATSAAVTAVTNPLPAGGGHEPETGDEVRRDAPQAYLVQERAVTPDDWADVATRDPRIQRAAATWRWTGSWHTIFLTADRSGGTEMDAEFQADQRARLERYRLAGYDLELNSPTYVPLELEVNVCVAQGPLRAQIRREVLAAISALFQPDRLTFAQPVYLSPVYAAAQSVPGVTSVTVTTFRRQQDTAVSGLDSGVLTMGRLEIARLDNNPNYPEHGVLTLTLGGGE
jgi:hypothetical protein